jgi:hypothetical protein
MLLHEKADSADDSLPAFLARPQGAPVYHGFLVLEDVVIDGFKLGMISGFGEDAGLSGDGFVVAPDNSRCGLVWEVGESLVFQEIRVPESTRWGVWAVNFPLPMTNTENARKNLEVILPQLKAKWSVWNDERVR